MGLAKAVSLPAVGTPRIVNHDIMSCTADGVEGNHLYSSRALGITEPEDVIQLHPALKGQWEAIHAHYERIGLSHTEEVIWHVALDELGRHTERDPSVFCFNHREHSARPDEGWFGVVDYINSKNNFMALAHDLGVKVPRTLCFDKVEHINEGVCGEQVYPCYLKAAISVSGVGIHRCADARAFRKAKTQFAPGTPVQIQETVETETFLNLQYQVTERGLERLAATEQVLDGCAHQGNRHPARHAPWESVEPMARWMFERGMRGIFAFDVGVVHADEGIEFPSIECNPRYNGASYPTTVANKLGVEQWTGIALKTRHRALAAIDLKGIEYDPATGRGVVMVNWGPILVGKLLCLLAGPPLIQEQLSLELQRRL